jgi:hypothetical protein
MELREAVAQVVAAWEVEAEVVDWRGRETPAEVVRMGALVAVVMARPG